MRWLVGLTLALVVVLGTAQADPFLPLSQRPKENGGLTSAQLDCFARADEAGPEGWDSTRIFAPIGRPCEVDRFAIVAGHQGGLRSVYGERDDCQYLEKQDNGRDCAALHDAQIGRVLETMRLYRAKQREKRAPLRILVYVHGGMVAHQNAVRSAEQAASWMLKDGYFPIFLIWHSDFPTAYGDYLCCVSDGDPLAVAQPFFFVARSLGDLTAGVARAGENFGEQQVRSTQTFADNGNTEFYLCAGSETLSGCPRRRVAGASLRDNVIYPPLPTVAKMNDRDGVSLRRRIAYPLLYPVRGVATIGSDLGARSWDNMVRRTRTAFTGVAPVKIEEQVIPAADNPSNWLRCPEAVSHAPLYGAFGQFMARLQRELGDIDWLDARITFVAHSMGAFVGNESARLFPCLPYERFVYMAGAAPIRDVQQSVFPILLRNPEVRFNNLMLHPLAESRELFRGGLAPQGSLLEWVDSMFAGPRSIDDKTVGKWRNVARGIDAIPEEIVAQTSFRIFPTQTALKNDAECNPAITDTAPARASAGLPAGEPRFKRCHPVMHGDFDDYTFWRERYWLGEFAG